MDSANIKRIISEILTQLATSVIGYIKFKPDGSFFVAVVLMSSAPPKGDELRTRIANFVTGRILEEIRPVSLGVSVLTPQEFETFREYEPLECA